MVQEKDLSTEEWGVVGGEMQKEDIGGASVAVARRETRLVGSRRRSKRSSCDPGKFKTKQGSEGA